MEHKKIDLYSEFGLERDGAVSGTLTLYRHADLTELSKKRLRPAMLVIPGGGYSMVSQRENEPIALAFYAQGFDCFVLEYDVAPHSYPVQLLEAGMAMLWLRRNAKALSLIENCIGVIGFSAGGHLAGCLSYLWEDAALRKAFGDECARIRPDATILSYPVITADERYWHKGSFVNFCGKRASFADYSLEKAVTPSAPPCFLWATSEDNDVPVQNSLLLYEALLKAGVSVEMHLFEKGWHGLATADIEVNNELYPFMSRVKEWIPLAVSFLQAHGFEVEVCPR